MKRKQIMVSKAIIDMVLKRNKGKNVVSIEHRPPAMYASMQPSDVSYAT
jgi:hypothetical protein